MRKKLLIIKLGGSIITEKNSSIPKIRTETIKNLSKEIKQILDSKKYQIILIHGAGSFGHPLAKKYNLHLGMKTDEQKYGFCLTDQKMMELNSLITKDLLNHAIPAISLSPRSFIQQSAGKLLNFSTQLIENYLKKNFVPVLFGDAILDDKLGCSILSGDIIISHLAQKLHADKVIFLSDIDGVFDSNPKINPQANLIKKISNENIIQILDSLTVHNLSDVTGEMKGKILSIKENFKDIPTYIINGLKKDQMTRCLTEQQVGTKLSFK